MYWNLTRYSSFGLTSWTQLDTLSVSTCTESPVTHFQLSSAPTLCQLCRDRCRRPLRVCRAMLLPVQVKNRIQEVIVLSRAHVFTVLLFCSSPSTVTLVNTLIAYTITTGETHPVSSVPGHSNERPQRPAHIVRT